MKIEKERIYKRARKNFEATQNIETAFECVIDDMKKEFQANKELNIVADAVANINAQLKQDINLGKTIGSDDVKRLSDRLNEQSEKLRAMITKEKKRADSIEFTK